MSKRKQSDFDDGFDDGLDDDFADDELLDDDELETQRSQRRHEPRGSTRPKGPRDRSSHKSDRRNELASLKAWGTPY